MGKMTYLEQLRHPNWQRRRLEVMGAAGFECEKCGDNESTLNVHHKRYVKGRLAWEYGEGELSCLCEKCHTREHASRDEIKRLLCIVDVDTALAALAALAEHDVGREEAARLAEGDMDTFMRVRAGMVMWRFAHPKSIYSVASEAADACKNALPAVGWLVEDLEKGGTRG
jgi:hypothetical protein